MEPTVILTEKEARQALIAIMNYKAYHKMSGGESLIQKLNQFISEYSAEERIIGTRFGKTYLWNPKTNQIICEDESVGQADTEDKAIEYLLKIKQ